jgi:hypothetical protein
MISLFTNMLLAIKCIVIEDVSIAFDQ